MKNRLLIVVVLLAGSLMVSCASTTARPNLQTWNQAEILNLVYSHPEVRRDWMVGAIEPRGVDTVVVQLADGLGQPTARQVVVVRRQAEGSWAVTGVKTFWQN